MPYLVVNADDLGLTEGTNRAIIDAHKSGIVTSTSLLANGYAFDHAATLARETPSLGVGVHLTLTEGYPVARNVDVLLAKNGQLPLSNQPFVRTLFAGRFPAEAVRYEFEAQIEKIIRAGIKPTHIDGHKYIHLLPRVTDIACELAKQFNIPFIRIPHRTADKPSRVKRLPGLLILTMLGTLAYRVAQRNGVQVVDRVVGFVDTGHLDQVSIQRLLHTPYAGITELLCHPAYRTPALMNLAAQGYQWITTYDFEAETNGVSSPEVRQWLQHRGWQLCHYGNLPVKR
jgi:predicted glycoside hydrolase/deacetylase ChbG (UPF0249 family)